MSPVHDDDKKSKMKTCIFPEGLQKRIKSQLIFQKPNLRNSISINRTDLRSGWEWKQCGGAKYSSSPFQFFTLTFKSYLEILVEFNLNSRKYSRNYKDRFIGFSVDVPAFWLKFTFISFHGKILSFHFGDPTFGILSN